MTIQETITEDIKAAMRAKDKGTLEALRAAKTALTLAGTKEGANGVVSDEAALKEIQRLVKQRNDAAEIYQEQGRPDLAQPETDQAAVLKRYLPEQMSEEALETAVAAIIAKVGASSPADMGKVMGMAMKELGGKADGKAVSAMTKKLLNS